MFDDKVISYRSLIGKDTEQKYLAFLDIAQRSIQLPKNIFESIYEQVKQISADFKIYTDEQACPEFERCAVAETPCKDIQKLIGSVKFRVANQIILFKPQSFLLDIRD